MPTKRTIIVVPKGSVEALCKELNVSRSSVYNALNKTTNSEMAQKIRRLALSDYGGTTSSKIMFY